MRRVLSILGLLYSVLLGNSLCTTIDSLFEYIPYQFTPHKEVHLNTRQPLLLDSMLLTLDSKQKIRTLSNDFLLKKKLFCNGVIPELAELKGSFQEPQLLTFPVKGDGERLTYSGFFFPKSTIWSMSDFGKYDNPYFTEAERITFNSLSRQYKRNRFGQGFFIFVLSESALWFLIKPLVDQIGGGASISADITFATIGIASIPILIRKVKRKKRLEGETSTLIKNYNKRIVKETLNLPCNEQN